MDPEKYIFLVEVDFPRVEDIAERNIDAYALLLKDPGSPPLIRLHIPFGSAQSQGSPLQNPKIRQAVYQEERGSPPSCFRGPLSAQAIISRFG